MEMKKKLHKHSLSELLYEQSNDDFKEAMSDAMRDHKPENYAWDSAEKAFLRKGNAISTRNKIGASLNFDSFIPGYNKYRYKSGQPVTGAELAENLEALKKLHQFRSTGERLFKGLTALIDDAAGHWATASKAFKTVGEFYTSAWMGGGYASLGHIYTYEDLIQGISDIKRAQRGGSIFSEDDYKSCPYLAYTQLDPIYVEVFNTKVQVKFVEEYFIPLLKSSNDNEELPDIDDAFDDYIEENYPPLIISDLPKRDESPEEKLEGIRLVNWSAFLEDVISTDTQKAMTKKLQDLDLEDARNIFPIIWDLCKISAFMMKMGNKDVSDGVWAALEELRIEMRN